MLTKLLELPHKLPRAQGPGRLHSQLTASFGMAGTVIEVCTSISISHRLKNSKQRPKHCTQVIFFLSERMSIATLHSHEWAKVLIMRREQRGQKGLPEKDQQQGQEAKHQRIKETPAVGKCLSYPRPRQVLHCWKKSSQ